MTNENKIRKAIRKYLFESLDGESECANMMGEMMVDEERLTNEEGLEKTKNRENFVGSHCFGEGFNNGDFAVFSYGEQFPIFLFDSKEKKWYENQEQYIFNGEPVEAALEHKDLLRPTDNTHTKSLEWMIKKLNSIKHKNGILKLTHTSVEPGTKN